jgi:6,7-dimethyl-8-ribityllumazine synthase
MTKIIEGSLTDPGGRFAIVAGRFNDFITNRLVSGCEDALHRHGISEDRIDLVWVPGSFELPIACAKAANSGRYVAVIALGTVIRGATPHFDYIAAEVSKGIAQVALQSGVPVLFGVLTTDTIEQAVERAGTKAGNKGYDAALGALEMVNLLRSLEG